MELSLTQRQIAKQAGVAEVIFSRLESRYIYNIRRNKITILANVLRISPRLIMVKNDTWQRYKPVNGEELELLNDYSLYSC